MVGYCSNLTNLLYTANKGSPCIELCRRVIKPKYYDLFVIEGDTLQHTIWHQPQEETIEASRRLTEALWHYFPGIRAYPSVGNHGKFIHMSLARNK